MPAIVSDDRNSRRLLWPLLGLIASLLLGIVLNASLALDPEKQREWSRSPDSVAITQRALAADGAKILSWWHGPWVEGEMYYRPLSSMLMWAEARLWGFHFFPYTMVSLLLHAGNSVLLFLLLYSMCPGPRWQRAVCGVVGALFFNLGHHPSGPYWVRARVAWGTMIWWPVQTDFASLLFALLSLLLLDRYLLDWQAALRRTHAAASADTTSGLSSRPRQRLLVLALLSFFVALLFKETPLVVIGIVPFMCLYRLLPWVKVAGSYAAIGGILFILRALFVPQASNPEWLGGRTFYKLLSFVHLLSTELLANCEIWEFVAVATMIGLIFGLRRLRVPALYIVIACLVWPMIVSTALSVSHNPTLATIPREMLIELRYLGVFGGFLAALVTAGTEPALIFVIGLFAVAAANVNRVGPHYWYYPAAMWGLVDGAVANACFNLARNWFRPRESTVESTAPAAEPAP